MSFWLDLENELKAAVVAAKAELLVIATKIKPVIQASAKELAQFALAAVIAEAPKVLSGAEKLDSAVQNVTSALASQGKAAAISVIATSVQTAYNEISTELNGSK